jgi:chemotaxis-related protein WspD
MSENLFSRPLPPGYRDELGALVAAPSAPPPPRTGSILIFRLGELRLALPTRVASAVAPVLHIARIPHRSGTVLLGLASFRGEILPCCSLSRILDVPSQADQTQSVTARTLILEEAPGRLWAVPIDGVLGVRISAGEPIQTHAPLAPQWLHGSFLDTSRDATGIFHLLDPETLFRQITLATA